MISRTARFAIAGLVFVADRLSKVWVDKNLGVYDTLTVIPNVFNIVHTENRGAAFGVFNQTEGALRTFLLVGVSGAVMLLVAYYLWRLPRTEFPQGQIPAVALSLVLGGAAGNLYDRALRGSVTDFLQVFIGSYEWPSFNVADSAISVGVVLLFLSIARAPKPVAMNADQHR